MRGRAASIDHAEYEILRVLIDDIDLRRLRQSMCPDDKDTKKKETAENRFDKAAANVAVLIQNMMDRRAHKLPKNHVDYKEKSK